MQEDCAEELRCLVPESVHLWEHRDTAAVVIFAFMADPSAREVWRCVFEGEELCLSWGMV